MRAKKKNLEAYVRARRGFDQQHHPDRMMALGATVEGQGVYDSLVCCFFIYLSLHSVAKFERAEVNDGGKKDFEGYSILFLTR